MADEIQLYRGDAGEVIPVYVMPTGEMQPVRQDLAAKLMMILESHERGQMAIADVQKAQNFILAKCREDYAQSLATVERMSDRALTSTESTIAHQQATINTLTNALATKSNAASNVSVTVVQEERDRVLWVEPEWFAWFVAMISIVGITMIVSARFFESLRPPQYQPQSSEQVEVRSL